MKNKRITVEFTPETVARLDQLRSDLGLTSTVDVLRMSVQVLSYLERERKAGFEIILRKEGDNGAVREKEPVFAGMAS
jgi:hypothetical protein